ncbi:YidH family protein [Escherichia coli]|nr:YidH family protein [Escherichia coli]EGD1079645.1 YidH family protein [Escherichia coli]
MKISRLGEAPDYRFSLANERTFLAWIRTALGFLAAGVGLDQLAPDFATPVIRELLALLLCLFSGGLAMYGYLRWLRNEKAMRLKEDLPYTNSLLIISLILMVVALILWHYTRNRNLMDVTNSDFSQFHVVRDKFLISLAVLSLAILFAVTHIHQLIVFIERVA